ncbi:acyl carrier protein [Nonomuraea sp. NPDC047897]|uniref:acyl carrier protein n=1 Tax=Nonomuraea sp. NPDC047897 TaxID=3364346 RepID=UPI003723137A
MTDVLVEREVSARLTGFIRERFLYGDPAGAFGDATPLLDGGILTSLNTAILLNFIHEEWGSAVPVEDVDPRAFHTVAGIASMLCERSRRAVPPA